MLLGNICPFEPFSKRDSPQKSDIDVDLAPSKRALILKKIREERGELNVVQVATFGTESSKAAIACACRGYRSEDCPSGIDVDVAQYMSSLVPVERGQAWTITECLDGDEEKGKKPIKELVRQIEQYPGLREIILGVEGLVCRRGQHASGVILYNNSPYDTAALMRSPNGDITTQFDLHKLEQLGDTKFDFLVTDICDKLSVAIDLLMKEHYFDDCKTKREVYNKYFHPQVIDLEDPKLWDALKDGSVQDVFQFNTEIGIQTAKMVRPRNPIEMTAANALLRLTAPEGQERPLDRYLRFKNNIDLWYEEMDKFGLTKQEQKTLEPYYLQDYGVPCNQEKLMLMVMDENISHFTLAESNLTRKVLAKKMTKKIPEIKEKFISQCPSKRLGEYCWRTMMLPQMTYSFSMVHSTLYSFIGIQTLLAATKYPSIYWDTACLIVNSQSIREEDDEEEFLEIEELIEEVETEDGDEETAEKTEKKKQKAIDYGRIAAALGKIISAGVFVAPPSINRSTFTFSPDIANNAILYGLSGIAKINEDIIKQIIAGRPYQNFDDFKSRIKLTKPQMINLIKCGAFDEFGDRVEIMHQYINEISDAKKRITLQNMKMLIEHQLIPPKYIHQQKVFNFTKYLKKNKNGDYYKLDEIALNFYQAHYDMDLLEIKNNQYFIKQTVWDKIYKSEMEIIKKWMAANQAQILNGLNNELTREMWDKYCLGTISKWEMDSVSYYSHEHELANVDIARYEFDDFSKLPEEPEIERMMNIKGKQIPILKIHRICGTVLSRDKAKKSVTILTTSGVVNVKIYGPLFAIYDRQISERDADGKKHVIERSIFSRGNKIAVCGVRDGDGFRAKKYKATPFHLVEEITEIDNETGRIVLKARNTENQ